MQNFWKESSVRAKFTADLFAGCIVPIATIHDMLNFISK